MDFLPFYKQKIQATSLLFVSANVINLISGGGPIHVCVPIHTHSQFSQRFVLSHGKDVYHIKNNYQIDHHGLG